MFELVAQTVSRSPPTLGSWVRTSVIPCGYRALVCGGSFLYKGRKKLYRIRYNYSIVDQLFGIVVNTSDCHPRGPGFDSRLYHRNFSGSIGSGTGSTQPREDNWVLLDMRSSKIRLRKLKLRLREKRFANHKAPCTAIWQQPLQSVLAFRGCSATDLI